MPTLPTGSKRGFTLLELMVVLFIMTILCAVAMVSIGPVLAEARLRATTSIIVAQLQYARGIAIATCASSGVLFDTTRNGFVVVTASSKNATADGQPSWTAVSTQAGRFRPLPDGITITDVSLTDPASYLTSPNSLPSYLPAPTTAITTSTNGTDDGQLITFTALGQGEDASITLRDAHGLTRTILVDAITGRCEVAN